MVLNHALKTSLNVHLYTPLQLRTTQSICEDHERFVADGSQHKRAKNNNAIREPLFENVPLDQVYTIQNVNNMCMHISL